LKRFSKREEVSDKLFPKRQESAFGATKPKVSFASLQQVVFAAIGEYQRSVKKGKTGGK
jgi:hypothetical protein